MKILYHYGRGERGVALVTMMLLSVLVVGLVLMALTNGMVGKSLTSAHLTRIGNVQCAEGNHAMGEALLLYVEQFADTNGKVVDPGGTVSVGTTTEKVVTINTMTTAIGGASDTTNDLFQEIRSEVEDQESTTSDILIINPNNPDCKTAVDIDYLSSGSVSKGGGDKEYGMAVGYADGSTGKACDNGTLYNILTTTTNVSVGGESTIRSVYYKCSN